MLKKTLVVTNGKQILQNLLKILPEFIADGAQYAIKESIKQNKPYLSIDKLLKSKAKTTPVEDKRYLSYFLEYIAVEILDLATNMCRDKKKKRITKEHVEDIIKADNEFKMIFIKK